jgi:hypothetical protein
VRCEKQISIGTYIYFLAARRREGNINDHMIMISGMKSLGWKWRGQHVQPIN